MKLDRFVMGLEELGPRVISYSENPPLEVEDRLILVKSLEHMHQHLVGQSGVFESAVKLTRIVSEENVDKVVQAATRRWNSFVRVSDHALSRPGKDEVGEFQGVETESGWWNYCEFRGGGVQQQEVVAKAVVSNKGAIA